MDLVKKLEELSSEFGEDAVDRALLRYMHQRKKSEAIAALRPGGRSAADREIMAQWCDDQAVYWGDDKNADFMRAMAKELRAPVAVTVTDQIKKAIFVMNFAINRLEHDFNEADVATARKDMIEARSVLSTALQAALAGEVK